MQQYLFCSFEKMTRLLQSRKIESDSIFLAQIKTGEPFHLTEQKYVCRDGPTPQNVDRAAHACGPAMCAIDDPPSTLMTTCSAPLEAIVANHANKNLNYMYLADFEEVNERDFTILKVRFYKSN